MIYTSAQNTMYLRDLIADGYTLPNMFNTVDNQITIGELTFTQAFLNKYNLYEIAYTTEELFNNALTNKINIVAPYYIDKIKIQKDMLTKAQTTYKRYNDNTNKTKIFETPLGDTNGAFSDNNVQSASEDTNNATEHYDGYRPDYDYFDKLKKINSNIENLIQAFLNEFKCLFINIQ